MKIPLERGTALGLCVSSVDTILLVVSIARVPCVPMLGPRSHANPTELVLALLACHVATCTQVNRTVQISSPKIDSLATSVLLDRRMALGALLRVTLDPIRSLAVVLALLQPKLGDRADQRTVIALLSTPKAEIVLVRASDGGHNRLQAGLGTRRVTLRGIVTARGGAEPERVIALDKVPDEKSVELGFRLFVHFDPPLLRRVGD